MRPSKVVMRRAPSRPCQHRDVELTVCDQPLEMRLSRSAIRGFDWLMLYRCPECDTRRLTNHEEAPAIALWGVVPWLDEPVMLYEDDGDEPQTPGIW